MASRVRDAMHERALIQIKLLKENFDGRQT
jgi:hypothetical protein